MAASHVGAASLLEKRSDLFIVGAAA